MYVRRDTMSKTLSVMMSWLVLVGLSPDLVAMKRAQEGSPAETLVHPLGDFAVLPGEVMECILVGSNEKIMLRYVCRQFHALLSFTHWQSLLEKQLENMHLSEYDIERIGAHLLDTDNVSLMKGLLNQYGWYASSPSKLVFRRSLLVSAKSEAMKLELKAHNATIPKNVPEEF